ncbi:hypothetical protein PENTCL1PPCAC_21531, partial [Pristionchus entomophagus]
VHHTGPYCKCEVDEFGIPLNWATTDIWHDVVIVLDTSEALSSTLLQEAALFVEILQGEPGFDVLTLDPKAPFYTRLGVIAMPESTKVLYDLNITTTDSVSDRVN